VTSRNGQGQHRPHLPPDIRALRFALGKLFVNQVLGQPGAPVHYWLEEQAPDADADPRRCG
jgi:hypothetical protein